MFNRRIKNRIISSLMLLVITHGIAGEMTFSVFIDFQATAQEARTKRLPILVLLSASDCDNCRIVKEDFLAPMLKSGEYADQVIIRVIETDSGESLRNFNGELQGNEVFANHYSPELTPTVVLLDAGGNQIAPAISGMSTVELYGGFLDEAIAASLTTIRQPLRTQP